MCAVSAAIYRRTPRRLPVAWQLEPLVSDKLHSIFMLVLKAATMPASEELRAAMVSVAADDCAPLCVPAFWERMLVEVVDPLVHDLEAKDAAAEGDAARQAQAAVDAAEARGHAALRAPLLHHHRGRARGGRAARQALLRLPPRALLRAGLPEGRLAGAQGGVPGDGAAAAGGRLGLRAGAAG